MSGEETHMDKPWGLGFNDRGHGHGDYAVVVTTGHAAATSEVVVKCDSRELAEYIVHLHNTYLRFLGPMSEEHAEQHAGRCYECFQIGSGGRCFKHRKRE
jgi:hypothetical protein